MTGDRVYVVLPCRRSFCAPLGSGLLAGVLSIGVRAAGVGSGEIGRWTENPFSVLPYVLRRDSRHSTEVIGAPIGHPVDS
jgi:hypothetical protein